MSLDSVSLPVTTALLSSFSYPAPLHRLGSKLGRDSVTLFRKKVLMSNEILETKGHKNWSFVTQIPAYYRNKLELWEDGKQNVHLPSNRRSCGWALTGNDPRHGHGCLSSSGETCKCSVVALSLGNRKPRFSDSLCSSETTDLITRCMCISHVLWEKPFIFFRS